LNWIGVHGIWIQWKMGWKKSPELRFNQQQMVDLSFSHEGMDQ
jgi:hypothetical protein